MKRKLCLSLLLVIAAFSDAARGQDQALAPGETRLLFGGDSLGGWVESAYGFPGAVRIEDGALILAMTDALSGVTWTGPFPRTNYEVTLEAMRRLGGDFFTGLTFPVGDAFCTLIVGGWGGTVVGLSSIDGRDASENATRTVRRFESGRWYRIRLRVEEERIQAWIDGEQVVDTAITGRVLSIRPEVRPSLPLGIATWQTTAALRAIRVTALPEQP